MHSVAMATAKFSSSGKPVRLKRGGFPVPIVAVPDNRPLLLMKPALMQQPAPRIQLRRRPTAQKLRVERALSNAGRSAMLC